MPQIITIYLSKNLISRIKTLRKGYWPDLQYLFFDKNYILDDKSLNQMSLILAKGIEVEIQSTNNVQFQNLNWLLKTNIELLQQIYIQGWNRIRQRQPCRKMKRKWKGINIERPDGKM